MKIVVIGGSGLIGTKVVKNLTEQGHEVLRRLTEDRRGCHDWSRFGRGAGPRGGGRGRLELAILRRRAGACLLRELGPQSRARREGGRCARHHVALSVVGTDRLPDSGYLRAKLAQERLIKTSGIPYTIIRATQFFEFIGAIAAAGGDDKRVRVSNASFQPIAADDVAKSVADAALGSPVNGMIEIAGPERLPMSEIVAHYLKATNDGRQVVSDPQARYFGTGLDDRSLVPGDNAHLGAIRFEDWLRKPKAV